MRSVFKWTRKVLFKETLGPRVNMQNTKQQLLGVLLLLMSFSVYGQEQTTTHIVEISSGYGYYNFDSDSKIKDAGVYTAGMGLYFSRRWAALLYYSRVTTTRDTNQPSQDIHVQNWHIDGHYFFNIERHLRPYLVLGYGQVDYDPEGEERQSKNIFNSGVGLYYRITPKWSIRSDVRIYVVAGENYNDNALTLSLGYRFGEGERGN